MKHIVNDGFPYYVELTGEGHFKEAFASNDIFTFLDTISEKHASFRYAEGKWSIKQIVGHITDHERIMMYRILRFSRKDNTLLSGYDQDLMVDNSRFDESSFESLRTDFKNVRAASLSFISSLSDSQLALMGKVWKYELSVESFLKATIGHQKHHFNILKERYF